MDLTCLHCNTTFSVAARKPGRKPGFCSPECRLARRKSQAASRPPKQRQCRKCDEQFMSSGSTICNGCKYASRPRVACSVCGDPTGWAKGRVGSATCNPCRKAQWEHGTRKGYRDKGCRCDACKAWRVESMREYGDRVKAREGVTLRVKYRKTPDVFCADCGDRLRFGGGGAPDGVAPRCLKCSRRRPHIPASTRAAIYVQDGYVCQLCGDATEPDADPNSDWYPTLDHIVLFSDGGTDNPENLRTAHRWCNMARNHGLFEEAS